MSELGVFHDVEIVYPPDMSLEAKRASRGALTSSLIDSAARDIRFRPTEAEEIVSPIPPTSYRVSFVLPTSNPDGQVVKALARAGAKPDAKKL